MATIPSLHPSSKRTTSGGNGTRVTGSESGMHGTAWGLGSKDEMTARREARPLCRGKWREARPLSRKLAGISGSQSCASQALSLTLAVLVPWQRNEWQRACHPVRRPPRLCGRAARGERTMENGIEFVARLTMCSYVVTMRRCYYYYCCYHWQVRYGHGNCMRRAAELSHVSGQTQVVVGE